MSESKTDKAKCTLSDTELIEKSNDWVSKLAKTGGKAWTLRIPVDFNYDPDMLFIELGNRLKNAAIENAQLKEVLKGIIPVAERGMHSICALVSEGELINKARQLLNTQEHEKDIQDFD